MEQTGRPPRQGPPSPLLACPLIAADGGGPGRLLSRQPTPRSSHNPSDAARPPPPPPFPPPDYSVRSGLLPSCGKEHVRARWCRSFWVPVSFLSSPFPGTLILIACFFAAAFFSNLKGLEPFLGLCDRQGGLVWRWGETHGGSTGAGAVSGVILGLPVQARDVAPVPAQSSQTSHVICALSEEGEKESCKQSSQRPVRSSLIHNQWSCHQTLH